MRTQPRAWVLAVPLIAAALTLLASCERRSDEDQPRATERATKLPPLHAQSWLVSLTVPGHAPASVAVPLGATSPRPVLVALHGAADRPEWQCGTWRGVTAVPFIVCPRGVPADAVGAPQRFTYANAEQLRRELRAVLQALKDRFGEHVASGPIVIGAFGRGAELALPVLREEPAFFSKVAFIEGGVERWSSSHAALFAEGGGERALFVCGRPSCGAVAARAAEWTKRAGADAHLVYVGPASAAWEPKQARQVRAVWDWLVGDDPRWILPEGRAKARGRAADN